MPRTSEKENKNRNNNALTDDNVRQMIFSGKGTFVAFLK